MIYAKNVFSGNVGIFLDGKFLIKKSMDYEN